MCLVRLCFFYYPPERGSSTERGELGLRPTNDDVLYIMFRPECRILSHFDLPCLVSRIMDGIICIKHTLFSVFLHGKLRFFSHISKVKENV